jgi:quercetin dioxygenase-like cupin family protein
MKHFHYTEVENLDVPEPAKKVKIRWLINEETGAPNFAMRRFEVAPGGSTPYHTHDWEHEVYVLEGDGVAVSEDGVHSFKNTSGKLLVFLCMIPLQK